jgi:thioredoxin reductase (NADPH)
MDRAKTPASFDAVIVGAGPAGLTCAIYLGRALVRAVILEKKAAGGNALVAARIENYPGFEAVNGPELVERMLGQVNKYRVPIRYETVTGLRPAPGHLRISAGRTVFRAKTAVIALGTSYRKLNASGESEFTGRGVSYCATCDGMFFKEKVVAMVGGGDSALKEVIYLARLAKKVYLVHRRREFRAERIVQEQVRNLPNVVMMLERTVLEIKGDTKVRSLRLKKVKTGRVEEIPADGLFINIGTVPDTDFLKGTLALDEHGYIVTDRNLRTSLPGVFAAGDVRVTEQRQIATAVGDGAIAAAMVEKYLGRR